MHRHFGQRPAFPGKHLVRRYLVGLQPYSRGASAGSHRSAPLETSQVPTPRVVSWPRRLRLTPGNANRVSSRMSHFPKGPPMIVGCTPQLPQKSSPNCEKSLSGVFRSPAGMHPVNWFLERYRLTRLEGPPTPLVSPRSTGCGRATALPGWRGSPTPLVSPRSTGCGRATALPGWSGPPTPPVSPRSTGCWRATALPGWSGCPIQKDWEVKLSGILSFAFLSLSKLIIDEMDRVPADHYGSNGEELDFIINYDINHRVKEQ